MPRWPSQGLAGDSGQNTFEYLLVIGLLAMPLIGALIVGFETLVPHAVQFICGTIDSGGPINACFG